jgi:hypothetical protein
MIAALPVVLAAIAYRIRPESRSELLRGVRKAILVGLLTAVVIGLAATLGLNGRFIFGSIDFGQALVIGFTFGLAGGLSLSLLVLAYFVVVVLLGRRAAR